MPTDGFSIQPLAADHRRDAFNCGVPALNAYLHRFARQDMDRGATVAYVAVPDQQPNDIAGYYTLAASGVRLDDFPPAVVKKLPKYPLVPATLLGRLAVGLPHRGKGLGEWMLMDALERSLYVSASVGSAAVIVDAKDQRGAAFYARYGFQQFASDGLRLFVPMRTIAALRRANIMLNTSCRRRYTFPNRSSRRPTAGPGP